MKPKYPPKAKATARDAAAPGIQSKFNEALALHQAGRLDQAWAAYQQVLALQPKHFDALHMLGLIAYQTGYLQQSLELIDKAIALNSDHAFAYNNRGSTLAALNRLQEALASYEKAIKLKPDYAKAFYNRGNTLMDLRQPEAALASLDQAIKLDPGHADALYNRGNTLIDLKRPEEALASYDQVIKLRPDFADAYNNRGSTLRGLKRLEEALASYQQAVKLQPEFADAFSNMGNTLRALDRPHEALLSNEQAIRLKPEHAEAWNNRGNALVDLKRVSDARASFEKAIEIQPDFTPSLHNLGKLYSELGDHKTAIRFFRDALRIDATLVDTHSCLIFCMDLYAGADTAAQQEERKSWNRIHAAPLLQNRDYLNQADAHRLIRIGYVSADFYEHSAASAFAALLGQFDRSCFEVIAYSNSHKQDAVTLSIQAGVTAWRDICDLPDGAVADLIRNDGIDILVDLSGHTLGNRLLVFARKPAPVQVSAIGYPTGTGMPAMDVLLADSVVIPPGERHLYAEQVRYLPSVLLYSRDPGDYPPVSELPALASGAITFGSFNRLSKITDEALEQWARLLCALPKSNLLLKAAQLDNQAARDRLMEFFEKAGIAPQRISLLGETTWVDHMRAFNGIDIALDSLPHGGGITTLESIMMGVPVVTLNWPTFPGRASASILTTLGLSGWIAPSVEQYVSIAVEKSSNLDALVVLRGQLRRTFAASIFGNPAAYVKVVESEYRKLWQEWCAKQISRRRHSS